MRIVVLTSSLGAGGAERVATTLCNFWAGRGDEVTLIPTFSGGGQAFYQIAPGVNVIYLADATRPHWVPIFNYPRRLFALRKLIIDRSPDVVVAFLPNVNVAAILATAWSDVPVIICERSDPSMQRYRGMWKVACQLSYRFADMLTVQTSAVAHKAAAIFPGIKKIRSVANPLPSEVSQNSRKKLGTRKILLSMGRLAPEKQVQAIIDTFAVIADDVPEWDLHIYGDGPLRPSIERSIQAHRLEGRVSLKGRTSEPWRVMAGADAFVMASMYEGFPNSLMEAMGIGLPCIAYDCPSGPREISNNGANALLVPLNDQSGLIAAMRDVMCDDVFRTSLGDSARKYVLKEFSLPSVAAEWDRLFREVGAIR